MYTLVIIVNKTVLCIWKLLSEWILKVLIIRKKIITICGDGYYCVDHFATYANIESMLYTWNYCNVLCQW